ncbi:MAG: hypothetical protein AABW56_01325 [Nanoarchaeota archaeon]
MQSILDNKKEESSAAEKIQKIRDKAASKNISYNLVYDSIGEGIEPIYFWLLDFLQDKEPSGLGMDEVIKYKDEYEAAVGSGYFSDLGTKATRMQEQAMKIMGTINTVIRSVINLVYDLREFDIRLETYDDLRSTNPDKKDAAEISLRVIWMDQVDVKRGRGSINGLAQQLQFVTLRDAFLYAKDEAEVEKIDLNERVKRILKSRLSEYLKWKSYSEKELRKRYNIEKAYLKSQFNSLKYYTSWVKPYLLAAKKLNMTNFLTQSGLPNPNIVNIFNNMEIKLSLFGKQEFKIESIDPRLANIKLNNKYYSCLEVEMVFRTVPRATQSQQGTVYIHSGRTDINMRAYSFTERELEEIKKLQFEEDMELIENMTDVSLKEIQDDIDKYVSGKEPSVEEKLNYLNSLLKKINDRSAAKEITAEIKKLEKNFSQKVAWENPFSGLLGGFGQAFKAFGNLKSFFKYKIAVDEEYYEKLARDSAKKRAEELCYVLYDVYKKTHGMMTW